MSATAQICAAALAGFLAIGTTTAYAQQANACSNTTTFLASSFTMPSGIEKLLYDVDNDKFTSTIIQPFKSNDVIAVMASNGQSWSHDTTPISIGSKQVRYPIMSYLEISHQGLIFLPTRLKFKTDVSVGAELLSTQDIHKNAFSIKTARAFKAGDSISVFFVNGPAIISVEASDETAKGEKSEPLFTAFESTATSDRQSATIEGWRMITNHVCQ